MDTPDSTDNDPILSLLPDRFQVRGRLGKGGMAVVYLAEDRLAGGVVALKVLHQHLLDDELVLARFRREIAVARRIVHPNVIAIHDLVVDKRLVCLVLEYQPGGDLKRHLRLHGPMQPGALLEVARQLLGGLQAAHDRGVVHRDLKPQNILLDPEGRLKITDFGLARVDDLVGLTTHTMSLGTPEYMAPELLSSPVVDARADLYSAGVTLFELATGKLPFRASTPMALMRLHESEPVPDPLALRPELPEAFARALVTALAKLPEDRFATAREMAMALAGEHAPSALPVLAGERCRSCQRPLLPGLSTCIECGHQRVRLHSGGGKSRVRIVRKGGFSLSIGNVDTLTFQQKHSLVEELRALGGEMVLPTDKLDKQLRKLPSTVACKLDQPSADLLVERLQSKGIDARGSRSPVLDLLRFTASFRVWGPCLGYSYLLAALVFPIMLAYQMPIAAGLAFTTLACAIFGHKLRQAMRPMVAFSGKEGGHATDTPLVQRAAETFALLSSPRLRAILRRVLARGLDLRRRAELSGELGRAVAARVDDLLDRALLGAREVSSLERELATLDPPALYETVKTLDEHIAAAVDGHETGLLIERKAEAAACLDRHGEVERELVSRTGELLALSARLDQAAAAMGELEPDVAAAGESLSMIINDLEAELEGWVEVEEG